MKRWAAILVWMLGFGIAADERMIYVSPQGDDAIPRATLETPVRTVDGGEGGFF